MGVRGLELITSDENEKPALRRIQEVLSNENTLPQSVNYSLPKLVGPNGETIEIPLSVFRILRQVVGYMMQGKAFSVIPHDQTLNIQEAADILNVARPFLVKLLESGELPFLQVGTYRYVQYSDLLEYKNHMHKERRRILAELANISQEAGEY